MSTDTLSAPDSANTAKYRRIELLALNPEQLATLSEEMKLSLSQEDMIEVQAYFQKEEREPTDVELEVIAQTWSEHCKHRIFGAEIQHRGPEATGGTHRVDSLFKSYIKECTEKIMERKPGFVLSCFHDNAGFIELDDKLAVCLKAETHNHPSAIEPYAGANTGLGGVIRDILGAGKAAKPVASLDVFCFGPPNTKQEEILGDDVIHPVGILRGVVRGVRDYGNRMGIPTITGAIQFDPAYIYNPLVFCGTAGVIERKDIDKEMKAGLRILAAGGRTGRDGLHGATFSSASLTSDSHEEDQQAVQIGNPIEEKKVADFILEARDRSWITFITDCGAGGFSSAAGEMLEEVGGNIYLERCPLKEEGLLSWEIFLSESQERMVMAVEPEHVDDLLKLADVYETECVEIGESDGSGVLKIWHDSELVCELKCQELHEAPVRKLNSVWEAPVTNDDQDWSSGTLADELLAQLGDFAVCSRAAIIREYDHEVQGNTILKPLAGKQGDAPQDGSAFAIPGSEYSSSMALSILPEWGKTDPYNMGLACVDECVRQLLIAGANPDKLAILDNFCVGNPDDEKELGSLVETVKAICESADIFGAPFVSGKDSFYNYFETEKGAVSIPTTILISGIGVIEPNTPKLGSSLRRSGSLLALIDASPENSASASMGGSVYARRKGIADAAVPSTDSGAALALYRKFAAARNEGLILSAHDVSEGGLAVTLAEAGFSEVGGVNVDSLPQIEKGIERALFHESSSRVLLEVAPENRSQLEEQIGSEQLNWIGEVTSDHQDLQIANLGSNDALRIPLTQLKEQWKNALQPYY